jgi:hypothetical protein
MGCVGTELARTTDTAADLQRTQLGELASEINREAQLVEEAFRSAVRHAIRAGELLNEAKAQVGHGNWTAWRTANFDGSERTAQIYMSFANNRNAVADLPTVRDALDVVKTQRTKRVDGIAEHVPATAAPELGRVREPHLRQEVWDTVLAKHGESATRRQVREVVWEHLPTGERHNLALNTLGASPSRGAQLRLEQSIREAGGLTAVTAEDVKRLAEEACGAQRLLSECRAEERLLIERLTRTADAIRRHGLRQMYANRVHWWDQERADAWLGAIAEEAAFIAAEADAVRDQEAPDRQAA